MSERPSRHGAASPVIPDGDRRCRFVWIVDVPPDVAAGFMAALRRRGAEALRAAAQTAAR